MKQFDLKNHAEELPKLLAELPLGSLKIYVIDATGEVDEELDFKDPVNLFDYLWENLHPVPVIYVVKEKKVKRIGYRGLNIWVEYEERNGEIVLIDYETKTSVSQMGNYKILN